MQGSGGLVEMAMSSDGKQDVSRRRIWVFGQRYTLLTCNAHPVAPVEDIPHHRPIADSDKSFRILAGYAGESTQTNPRPTEYQSLEA